MQQAQAALDQALANLQQGKANEELARVTAERWSNLVAKGVVSRQENDQYQAQYQAQAANVEALEKAIAAARSNVASSEANLARLERSAGLQDREGAVRRRDHGPQHRRRRADQRRAAVRAQELFHIAATAKLRVFVNVPQIYSRAAVAGIAAELTLAEFPGRRFPRQTGANRRGHGRRQRARCSPKWMSTIRRAS